MLRKIQDASLESEKNCNNYTLRSISVVLDCLGYSMSSTMLGMTAFWRKSFFTVVFATPVRCQRFLRFSPVLDLPRPRHTGERLVASSHDSTLCAILNVGPEHALEHLFMRSFFFAHRTMLDCFLPFPLFSLLERCDCSCCCHGSFPHLSEQK